MSRPRRDRRPAPKPARKPGEKQGLRPQFWENVPLPEMTGAEWEALCDGCGKCCLNKLEDEETGEVAYTRIACRLLDDATCRCTHYETRHSFVPDCVTLSPDNIATNAYWMPVTCAYRLLWEGRPLEDWHPLISGDPGTVHKAGVSCRNITVSEFDVPEEDWEDYLIEGEV
ncbi:YcgN family cysteine cluster protein [Tropicimonas omnivorans]|uniref:YcgN family cysteine cluster protein n=1 Tax=Tropicimonas omnivorans TaxID=3075590 RepID=UPI003D76B222